MRTGSAEHVVQPQLHADEHIGTLTEEVRTIAIPDLLDHIAIAHIRKAIGGPHLGGKEKML